MSDSPAHNQASERAADLAQLLIEDPRLYELLMRSREAYNDLAAYMAEKCVDAGQAIPIEWLALMMNAEKRRKDQPQDKELPVSEG